MTLTAQDFLNVLAAIDTETTRIANKIAELIAAGQANGLTSAEEADIKAKIDAELDKLKAIGADPQNPVPTPEPTPEPTPGEQP